MTMKRRRASRDSARDKDRLNRLSLQDELVRTCYVELPPVPPVPPVLSFSLLRLPPPKASRMRLKTPAALLFPEGVVEVAAGAVDWSFKGA